MTTPSELDAVISDLAQLITRVEALGARLDVASATTGTPGPWMCAHNGVESGHAVFLSCPAGVWEAAQAPEASA